MLLLETLLYTSNLTLLININPEYHMKEAVCSTSLEDSLSKQFNCTQNGRECFNVWHYAM